MTDRRGEMTMEALPNPDIGKEFFLKIDTVWSEADSNIESLCIKEEILSDLDPDSSDESSRPHNPHIEKPSNGNPSPNDSPYVQLPAPIELFQRGLKTKKQRLEPDHPEFGGSNLKSTCPHDTKNFQIINRKLRCGDCRSLVCPECFKIMLSTLHNHFLGFDTSNCGVYSCKFCSFPFQSVCALQAHIRIHTMETPYICPDCGLIYSNAYFLILHLINKCFHVYKIVRYKCANCPEKYYTCETFSNHIQEFHFSSIFRCSYCSLLFNSTAEFEKHVDSIHQKQKVQYLNYFRCSLCSNMAIPSFMFDKHISRHRENSESYEVDYECLCGDVFSLIGAFRAHVQFCNRKGILPPHWGFLRKNLKSQDIGMGGNVHRKDEHGDLLKVSAHKLDSSQYAVGKINKNSKISEKSEESLLSDKSRNSSTGKRNLVVETEMSEEVNNVSGSGAPSQVTTRSFQGRCEDTECHGGKRPMEYGQSRDPADTNEDPYGESKSCEPDDSCKPFYDYIPCDHLGYVKAQGPETALEALDKAKDVSQSLNNFNVVVQLDEKTGMMVSKKILPEKAVSESEEEKKENEGFYDEEAGELNLEECGGPFKSPDSRCKSKSGTSFGCPFCSVSFPKNSSTFQQFRLHLEYYHPDAALNITVCGKSRSTDQTIVCTSPNNADEKPQSSKYLSKPAREEGKEDSENAPTAGEREATDEPNDGDASNAETHQRNHPTHKTASKPDFYWTVNLSVESSHSDSGKNEFQGEGSKRFRRINLMGVPATSDLREPVAKDVAGAREPVLTADQKKQLKAMEKETNGELSWTMEGVEGDDWENSKDSSWTNGSDAEYLPSRGSPESYLLRPKATEKSKRESEVWSEFYESLQIAEKLKKNRKKSCDFQSQEKAKEHSTVTEYSAKRIVKKPKRYRESSDSEYSVDNLENSDSEMDFTSRQGNDPHTETLLPDDRLTLDRQKKKILINKLKNIDQRLVDYLFDLVTKKEKHLDLFKKHFGLAGLRHGQTLRNYRKKVLNGIKLRGRPLKHLTRDYPSKITSDSLETPRKQREDQERRSRRGRPRKPTEGVRLKDRRRSDKEVDFIERNFDKEDPETSPTKRKRKLSFKLQYYRKINSPNEKDDFSSGQVITGKTGESTKRFACAVCKQTFQDSKHFRDHIVTHRQEDNTYQCMECGECFVVRPSLEKHLHAFHKIRNTDQYIKENDCGNAKRDACEPEREALKENQCKVCRDQFDRAIDLTKHFRIHGMAFLREFKKEAKPRP